MVAAVNVSSEVNGVGQQLTRQELVDLLDAKIAGVPVEHQGSVRFEVERYIGSYQDEGYFARLQMTYSRPENDDEKALRLKTKKKFKDQIEAHERSQYEELCKKYGPKS